MGRETLVMVTCDGCGKGSLAGTDFQALSLSAPGRLTVIRRWELCAECVAWTDLQLQARLISRKGHNAPVEIDLG